MELLTAAQMRAIEQAAIASGQVTGLELMERAGRGVVEAIFAEWPELAGGGAGGEAGEALPPRTPPGYLGTENGLAAPKQGPRRAVVLCGPGNNGGDGFVVARLLRERGWAVEVFLYGDPGKLLPDARVNYERWRGMGEVGHLSSAAFDGADLVVDAVFGTGLTRGFEIPAALNFEYHHFFADQIGTNTEISPPYCVAVDVVSELDADSGRVLNTTQDWGGEMGAHLTVTFHAPKVGHYLNLGPAVGGKLAIVDIGLAAPVVPSWDDQQARRRKVVELVDRPGRNFWETSISKTPPHPYATAHKYTHGHALILSGPAARTGAARLAARGALRIGAGLVTVGAGREALAECAAHLTAVMVREVGDGAALAEVLADARINALCLGPGLGLDGRARGVVAAALGVGGAADTSNAPDLIRGLDSEGARPEDRGPGSSPGRSGKLRPTVLDADALTLLSRDPALFAALHRDCVLTPHHGEFARLFPDIAEKLAAPATKGPAYSKVDATREAAARAGCVVLYKGPDTVIADPDGRCSINSAAYDRAAPWLATAGSGDVLAGFIAGLLARGFAPMQAAETAAWLHVECARSFGPGLIAEDLPEELPKVFRALGL